MDKELTIFISHISQEADLAALIQKQITKDFHNIFKIFVSSDGESILGGDQWLATIQNALKEAYVLIVLCSANSVERPWINFEVGASWIRGIPIIPLCHSDMLVMKLPAPLSYCQGINLSNGITSLYATLTKVVQQNLIKKYPCPSGLTDFTDFLSNCGDLERRYSKKKFDFKEIKLLNPYGYLYEQIKFLRFGGKSIDEIVNIILNNEAKNLSQISQSTKDIIRLIIEHCLGLKMDKDIAHLCPPRQPNKIEYIRKTSEGHLCLAKIYESEEFYVLIRAPKINVDDIKEIIKNNHDFFCYLSFKNAHRGYPCDTGDEEIRTASASIHISDLNEIMP